MRAASSHSPSGSASSASAAAAMATLKRALDSPRAYRRVFVADVLTAPLWTSGAATAAASSASAAAATNGASAASHAQAGASTSAKAANASEPVANDATSFEFVSLRFGAPSFELGGAQVCGKLLSRVDTQDTALAHFLLQDDSGDPLRISLPLNVLFAALPLQAKRAVRGRDSSSCAVLFASSAASTWLPAIGDVLEVSGAIQLCRRTNTRQLLASSYSVLLSHHNNAATTTAEALLRERGQQIRQLYESHFFRALHMPPPPPAMPTPQRSMATSTPSYRTPPSSPMRTPATGAAVAGRIQQATSPFSAQVASSSGYKRTGFGVAMQASPTRPVGSRLNFNTPQPQQQQQQQFPRHPQSGQHTPLPLPLPQSQSPTRPRSYLDDFASSQEERAHVAMAEQITDSYLQQQQQQLVQQSHTPASGRPVSMGATPNGASSRSPQRILAPAQSLPLPTRPAASSAAASFVPPRGTAKDPAAAAALAARLAAMTAATTAPPPDSTAAVGFLSGRGAAIKPSAAALLKAQQLAEQWSKEDETLPAVAAGAVPAEAAATAVAPTRPRSPSPPPPVHEGAPPADFVLGFSSGRGKAVQISDAAQARAKKMFKELEEQEAQEQQNAATAVFRTPMKNGGANASGAASSGAAFAGGFGGGMSSGAKPFKPPASIRPPPSRVASAAPVAAVAAAAAAAEGIAPDAAVSTKAVDMEAIRKAKRDALDKLLADDDDGVAPMLDDDDTFGLAPLKPSAAADEGTPAGAATAAAPAVGFGAASAFTSSSPTADLASMPFTGGFTSGSGRSVAVSDAARQRAEKLFRELEAEEQQQGGAAFKTPSKPTAPAAAAAAAGFSAGGFGGGAKPFKPPSSTRPLPPRGAAATAAPTSAVSSGGGAAASSAAEAIRKAKLAKLELMERGLLSMDENDDARAYGLAHRPNEVPDGATAASSFGSASAAAAAAAENPSFEPAFTNGAGRAVAVSAAARQRAEQMMREVEAETAPSFGGTRAAAAGAASGGFQTSAKPFKPPAVLHSAAPKSSPNVASVASSRVHVASVPSASSAASSAAAARRARMALLDAQLEAMENDTTAGETSAAMNFGPSAREESGSDAGGFASAASNFGFGSAASHAAASHRALRSTSQVDVVAVTIAMHSSDAEGDAAPPSPVPRSPLIGHKRKSMLSEIPEESSGAMDSGTQPLESQIPASQLSQPFITTLVRPLPPAHPTTHSTPVPVVLSQEDCWPGLATPAPASAAAAAVAASQRPPSDATSSSSPMPALVAPSPGIFTTPLSMNSANITVDSSAPTEPAAKRARITSAGEFAASPLSSGAASASATIGVPAPSPIPIPCFLPSPAASPVRAAPATPSTPAAAAREVSPPGSTGSQIIIPATPSLESQPMQSLEMQFDAVAAEEEEEEERGTDAPAATSLEVAKQQQPPLDPLPPATPSSARVPFDPYLPPTPDDVLPVLGSPAALRALASSRVATFGSPAAPPECTVHHVLFALKDVLAATAPAPRLLSSPSCTSRARVWQRTELLLTDEFAEGEVERIWTADKRNTFAKIKHVWAQQFEQMLTELERQGQVLCDREQQRITLLHAP